MIAATATRFRGGRWARRGEAFVDVAAGVGVGPGGGTFRFRPARTVAALLAAVPDAVDRVYLVGPPPGVTREGLRRWAAPSRLPGRWTPSPAGHFVERAESPLLKFTRTGPGGRETVEIHRAASWYGEGDYGPEIAAQARHRLARLVAEAFPKASGLAGTPSTTGIELWRSTIRWDHEWACLPPDDAGLVHATMGQGRTEVFLSHVGQVGEVAEVAEYDARWAYAAACREVPGGVPVHDEVPELVPYVPGRYRVRVTIPADWSHVGLLGVQESPGVWRYPAEPGRTFETWADGAELEIARRAGWAVRVAERIVWPAGGGTPLRGWADRLIRVRRGLDPADPTTPLVAGAVRALLIFTIGRFAAGARLLTRSAPLDEPGRVPANAHHPRVEGAHFVWGERVIARPDLYHPEYAAAVYGRTRARLLVAPTGTPGVRAGALTVPKATILRFATDSLTLTGRAPWPDDGAPGRLRLKGHQVGPFPAPRTPADLFALIKGGRAHVHS